MRTATEANIQILRNNGILSTISVNMPIWNKLEFDGTLSVSMPLFSLRTYALNEDDSQEAIKESLICFSIGAEKFGQGLEKELQTLGWEIAETSTENLIELSYSIKSNNNTFDVMEEIIQTADIYALSNIEIG